MKFIIDGTEYEAGNLERITGVDALELPRQAGMGIQTLARRLDEMSRLGYGADGSVVVLEAGDAGITPEAVTDSEVHLRALFAFLWVSRRLDGEKRLTFEDSCAFQFASLEIIDDEPAEVVVADPTQAASVVDADSPATA